MRLPYLRLQSCFFIIPLLLRQSQVRSETLKGYLSIYDGGSAEYAGLNTCLRGCLYLELSSGKNGLVDILGCDLPAPNACDCIPDQLQRATSAISSCITADCINIDAVDISTAIKVYTDYCSTVSAQAVFQTAAAKSSTTSESNSSFRNSRRYHSAKQISTITVLNPISTPAIFTTPTPTSTATIPTNTGSGGGDNNNCPIGGDIGNNSGTIINNCGGSNNGNGQTSGASRLGGLSQSDKIAIGIGLGLASRRFCWELAHWCRIVLAI